MALKLPRSWPWWLLGAAVFAILLFAPAGRSDRRGSSYSRSPDGYAAWVAYLEERGKRPERWQRSRLPGDRNVVLLKVYSNTRPWLFDKSELDWVERGNTLIILGVRSARDEANGRRIWSAPVSDADIRTPLPSAAGPVRVETRRRYNSQEALGKALLTDRFGDVVREYRVGKGRLVTAVTPDLGANAYQEEPGNYRWLTELVSADGLPVLIDEAIHGYLDSEDKVKTGAGDWSEYLARTPLLIVGVQLIVAALVLLWAGRRFGRPLVLAGPALPDSDVYIQALAQVLRKAGSIDFVRETIAQEERLRLQQALGLGGAIVETEVLAETWTRRTGQPAGPLLAALEPVPPNEPALRRWLERWQTLHNHLKPDP